MQGEIRIAGQVCEGQQLDEGQGHDVRVTIIQGGRSINGYSYDAHALRTIAQMIEGAQAYVDHSAGNVPTRSVRDIVGFYHDAVYEPPAPDSPGGRVDATLHVLEAAGWLWSMIREACELGRPELVGLSIDILGHWQHDAGTKDKHITQVVALNSCDVVTRPSAGGALRRILHAEEDQPVFLSREGDSMNETAQIQQAQQNQQVQQIQPVQPEIQESVDLARITEQQRLEQQRIEVEQLVEQVRRDRASLQLDQYLHASNLPQALKDQIRARYSGRIFEERELKDEISSSRTLLAQLAQEGIVRGHAYEKLDIGSQITEAEKIQAAFDRMFELDIDTSKMGNIRGFSSIREAYARVTGDASLYNGLSQHSTLGSISVSENAPINRITEADTTTASFSYLLGTSMNKRLLKDYQAWPAEWQKFVTIVAIRDFKQQSRVRLGAFGSLPVVAEDTPYSAVTLTDSAATYVPQKRGNLVTVSRETIINDDLQAIKQIPTKLAVAAAYTLAEFVYSFLSTNPTIYDGNVLFTTGAPHSNLGTSALSSVAMQTGITAMREQTNYAGKRLGLRPRYLIVPPEMEWTSMIVTKSAGVPGSNNNDINPMLGYVTPIVSPQLSSPTQWFLAGDPREIDTIEIGFVGGQVNPALYVQDSPLLGLNFTQDAISYKCRQEYGGAVIDWRGLWRGI